MSGRRRRRHKDDISLSRLSHWLPRSQAHPEVVQRPAQFHHESPDTFFPQVEAVLDDATTLDTTIDVLGAQSALVQGLIPCIIKTLAPSTSAEGCEHRRGNVLGGCWQNAKWCE